MKKLDIKGKKKAKRKAERREISWDTLVTWGDAARWFCFSNWKRSWETIVCNFHSKLSNRLKEKWTRAISFCCWSVRSWLLKYDHRGFSKEVKRLASSKLSKLDLSHQSFSKLHLLTELIALSNFPIST